MILSILTLAIAIITFFVATTAWIKADDAQRGLLALEEWLKDD